MPTVPPAGLPGGGPLGFATHDALVTLQRERGQLRASHATIDRALRDNPGLTWLELLRANSLARLGDTAAPR